VVCEVVDDLLPMLGLVRGVQEGESRPGYGIDCGLLGRFAVTSIPQMT
jgi:hypothetical protein